MNERIRESDHELLQDAAKAAGYEKDWQWNVYWLSSAGGSVKINNAWHKWNPLSDDGDAFRLAVKLNLHISVFVDAIGIGTPGNGYVEFKYESDPYAATRRAIVRAAAEIGRNMV